MNKSERLSRYKIAAPLRGMTERKPAFTFDSQQRRMVAAVAAVAESTVRRYLRGEPLQPNSRARIRRAIAALVECGEIEHEAHPTERPRPAPVLMLVPPEPTGGQP